ncbi:hypothetical protein ABL78_7099 [Leptomonas seymouri]|uniref:Uncharacterized protein n=1 Tax=Leptomonas seymouri TaxID=5684 RepID=A0A0N1PCG7_LEPSE|nr:hypothetical protein ABL78_7099 [Leptomonas seymouri]|eukprot:KPI83862.1 hypothetical protein ABL78_7099 [Leptomonas seymouri]
MSFLHLSSYNTVCWRPDKASFVDVVTPLSLTDAAQPPSTLDGVATPIALACIKQPKQELALWLSWKGYRDFRKSPKAFHSVLHVCTDGSQLGVFYTQNHGEDLSFALVEYAKGDVESLLRSPKVYATEVAALMHEAVPEVERRRRRKSNGKGPHFVVHQGTLRHTTRGYVVAAIVSTEYGALYGIVGDLEANAWRKWKVRSNKAGAEPTFCIFISATGAEVRFVRCDIEAPVDPDIAISAPNISLALSAFDRVSAAAVDGCGEDADAAEGGASLPAPHVVCAVLRECILPTRADKRVTQHCYQSHAFPRVEGEVTTPYSCFSVVEDKAVPVYTVVVFSQKSSYVVHASYALGGGEFRATATAIPQLHHPVSVCSLRIPTHPHRPSGTTMTLVLCRDMKLYACEHFGRSVAVEIRINHLLSSTVTFAVPPQFLLSKKLAAFARGLNAATASARLIALRGGTEVMCTNGVVGVFFRVSAASLLTVAPALKEATIAADPAAHFGAESDGCDSGATALRNCLTKLGELSLCTARHNWPDVVFREVIPLLRYVGTSQQEVMLTQRVYEELLRVAEPSSQSEWNYLWALTSAMQRTLAKRNAENRGLYTDAFFLHLADTYRHSAFASPEGTKAVEDTVRAGVSNEVAQVLTSQPACLTPEVHYVLDGCAEGVSPVDLAEEVARRMVQTSTQPNGACVVSTHPKTAECVHGMGCVLLASCLDLSVLVYAQERREMRVCVQQPTTQGAGGEATMTASSTVACVAVPPYAFFTQDEFETALTLAADLLCVPTADASFRPDVALLTLAIGTRQHCLTAFVHLFAPVLRSAVEEVAPLANNTAWLEACTATLSRSYAEQVTALLNDERSSGASLTTTLSYVLYAPQKTFNAALFHTLSYSLSEEFCTTVLVACVFHQTERLVAAMHNCAAALATYTLSKAGAEGENRWQAAQVGKRRLRSTLSHTYALWARMSALSPYQVRDVSSSYRMSVRNSLGSSSAGSPAAGEAATALAARGTVVSRTLVACFRLLCLVQYCCDVEDDMMEPPQHVVDDIGGRRIESCTRAVQALYLLRGSPLPLEWFQRGFVSLVQQVAAAAGPTWTPYLVRLLQLSNVRQSGNAALKRDFYRVLDALQAQSALPYNVEVTAEVIEAVQRATAAVESSVTALTLLEELPGQHQGGIGASSPPPAPSTVHFVFSVTRDPSLPRWTSSHALPEHRYLFSNEWTEVLWALERMPEALLAACKRTVSRVTQVSVPAEVDAAPPALSAEMANPLFAHLCRLRPPVRVHSLPPHSTEASTTLPEVPSVVQRQPMPTVNAGRAEPPIKITTTIQRPEPPASGVATPEKLKAPRETPQIPSPSAQPQEAAAPQSAVHIAAHPLAVLSDAASPPPPSQQQQQQQAIPAVANAAPSPVVDAPRAAQTQIAVMPPAPRRDEVKETSVHPRMYGPADVAWWDSIGLPVPTCHPSPSSIKAPTQSAETKETAAVNTVTGDDNGESSDTATSYTTSTSNYADPFAALDEFGRTSGRPCRGRKGTAFSDSSSHTDGSYADRTSALCHHHRKAASSRSPLLRRSYSKKKCHCCHHRRRGGDRVKEEHTFGEELGFSLKWSNSALETEVKPLQRPPREASTARPTLLSFTTRLQPPEEPSRSFAQTARAPSQSHPPSPAPAAGALGGPNRVALLRLPTASSSREPSRVRLYTLRGERVEAAGSGDVVSLQPAEALLPSRGTLFGRAAPLTAPAVPPSSVFVAPPALLQLPPRVDVQKETAAAANATSAAPPTVTGAKSPSYLQAARAPAGPAPPAVDLSVLHGLPADVQQQRAQSLPTPESAVPSTPASPAVVTNVALPIPVPPSGVPAAPTGVLNPSQLADFHRYTDDLLARQAAPVVSQAAAVVAAESLSDAPSPVNAGAMDEVPADCPGVTRLIEQQEDFIRKANALMQTRQAENEGFYRRVVESIRSLTAASQQLRGLTPVEQSQLVRDTVKQRNELMNLNHQLLEMQLAAARVSGEMPPSPPQQHPSSVPKPALTLASAPGSAMQTAHPPSSIAAARSSAGVLWAAPVATPLLASVPTQTPEAPKIGMQEALSDLQRLNTELMGVSASAEAMDKAIKETREVIQRYERTKTAEALAAEGVALTAAMRVRTAAIEQRLAELPRCSPPLSSKVPVSLPPTSRGWTVRSSPLLEAESGEGAPSGLGAPLKDDRPSPIAAPLTVNASCTNTAAPSYTQQFTARLEPTDLGDDARNSPHKRAQSPPPQQPATAAPTPLSGTLANSQVAPLPNPSLSSLSPPPPLPPSSGAPPTTTTASASVPPPLNSGAGIDHSSPSVSFAQTREAGTIGSYHPHRSESTQLRGQVEGEETPFATPTQACAYMKPLDLHTLFVNAGGVAHAGAHTLSGVSTQLHHPPSLVPKSASARRSTTNATGVRNTVAFDRYAMYRVPPKQLKRSVVPSAGPSSCLPRSSSASGKRAVDASSRTAAVAAGGNSTCDVYVDRQHDRRMASIARRMQQLEHDLFD